MAQAVTHPTLDLDGPIDIGPVGTPLAIQLYERMALIREFEQRVMRVFLQGQIAGTIHLSTGQEACAVGATAPLQAKDIVTITHRGHGQALAKGVSARSLMAELFGQETGCCRGHGGSMHIGDLSVGALTGNGVVGGSVPIAAGLAFASWYRGDPGVVVSFLGEAAITEGDTHEGFNIAALWEIPVVYVCENNNYAISTPLTRQMKAKRVSDWAAAYGMPGVTVDGNNVVAVYEAVKAAVERARNGQGPSLVDCLTYRQGGHKRDDPATYRPPEEVEMWLRRDPLVRLRQSLEMVDESEAVERAHAEATAVLDDAIAFAEQGPLGAANLNVENVEVGGQGASGEASLEPADLS